jgi:hypothetical protein
MPGSSLLQADLYQPGVTDGRITTSPFAMANFHYFAFGYLA